MCHGLHQWPVMKVIIVHCKNVLLRETNSWEPSVFWNTKLQTQSPVPGSGPAVPSWVSPWNTKQHSHKTWPPSSSLSPLRFSEGIPPPDPPCTPGLWVWAGCLPPLGESPASPHLGDTAAQEFCQQPSGARYVFFLCLAARHIKPWRGGLSGTQGLWEMLQGSTHWTRAISMTKDSGNPPSFFLVEKLGSQEPPVCKDPAAT